MESLDAEFSGPPFHRVCESRHFFTQDCPEKFTVRQHHEFSDRIREKNLSEAQQNLLRLSYQSKNHVDPLPDNVSAYPQETLADAKAKEAKLSVAPLTPVEKFVAMATHTNYKLFRDALDKACDEIEGVFNTDWIPEGDPHFLMHRFDNAKNFLVLASTYFTALATPVMQACSVHLTMQAMAPAEPSAEERQLSGPDLKGRRIIAIHPCAQAGISGMIADYDPDDGDYIIKFDDGKIQYHERSCFQLEK